MKRILFVVLVLALLSGATVAQAEVIAWDKSSVELTGVCLPNGDAQFTATNTGRGMDGPTAWREYEADTLTQQEPRWSSRRRLLRVDVCQQGRAGAFRDRSQPALRIRRTVRAGTLSATAATSQARRAASRTFTATTCRRQRGRLLQASGNINRRGLACVITAYRPGYVSGNV